MGGVFLRLAQYRARTGWLSQPMGDSPIVSRESLTAVAWPRSFDEEEEPRSRPDQERQCDQ